MLPSESPVFPIEGTLMKITAELWELITATGIMLEFK